MRRRHFMNRAGVVAGWCLKRPSETTSGMARAGAAIDRFIQLNRGRRGDHVRWGAVLFLLLCLAPAALSAQGAGRVYRIGFLWLGSADGASAPAVDAFRAGLRARGYSEGANLVIELRDGHGRSDLLPRAAAELVALKVDAILTAGTAATIAAKDATGEIPIVFGGMDDPVGRGVVATLSHPGGNVTGFSRELGLDKAVELLKTLAPSAHRVGLIYHSGNMPAAYLPRFMAERAASAQSLGLTLVAQPVRNTGDVDAALAAMTGDHADAALIMNDTLLYSARARLLGASLERRLPTVCLTRGWVRNGCLASYGEDPVDSYRRAAVTVDKILKGAKPADLPVEQATKFELVINLSTARALGLTVPADLLALADEVIE